MARVFRELPQGIRGVHFVARHSDVLQDPLCSGFFGIVGPKDPSRPPSPCSLLKHWLMRCAKGIFAKGILGGTGFSLLRWESGLRLPLAVGKRSETPSFLLLRPREQGSLRPFFPSQKESQTLFPTAKGKTPYLPKSP